MLLIRCSSCKNKLWKYDKVGPGEVLRCHFARITRKYSFTGEGNAVKCPCGKKIAIIKNSHYKMIAKAFTCSGTKRKG